MKRWDAEPLAANLVPIECLQMPEVKDQSMPFRNWPGVVGFRSEDLEQLVGSCSARSHSFAKHPINCR